MIIPVDYLRDHLAAAALTGLLLSNTAAPFSTSTSIASAAYDLADAMLLERSRRQEERAAADVRAKEAQVSSEEVA